MEPIQALERQLLDDLSITTTGSCMALPIALCCRHWPAGAGRILFVSIVATRHFEKFPGWQKADEPINWPFQYLHWSDQ